MNIHEHSHLATEGELAGLLIVSPGLLPLRNIHCNFFSFDFYEYFYESEGRYLKKIICVRFQSKVLSVYKYIERDFEIRFICRIFASGLFFACTTVNS